MKGGYIFTLYTQVHYYLFTSFTSILVSICLNDFIIIYYLLFIIYHYKLQRLLFKTIVILNKNICKIATKNNDYPKRSKKRTNKQHTYM
jgi:hypothetical protein